MKKFHSSAYAKAFGSLLIAFMILHATGIPIIIAASAVDVTTGGSSSSSSSSSSDSDSGSSKDSDSSKSEPKKSESKNTPDKSLSDDSLDKSSEIDKNSKKAELKIQYDSSSSTENPTKSGSDDIDSKSSKNNLTETDDIKNEKTSPGSDLSGNNTSQKTSSNDTTTKDQPDGANVENSSGNISPAGNSSSDNENTKNDITTETGNSLTETADQKQTIDNSNLGTGATNAELETGIINPDLGIGVTNPGLAIGTTDPNIGTGLTDPNVGVGLTEPQPLFMMAPMMLMGPMVPTGNPTITINGSNPATVTQGSSYSDAGASAVDSLGNSIPVDVVSNVDTSIVGTYLVTYSATDSAGNSATDSRTVEVVAAVTVGPPTITILGANPDSVTQNSAYSDPGATAIDSMGMSLSVTTISNVDTTIVGSYAIDYSATDSLGQTATASRTVNVIASIPVTPPVITILGNNPETVNQNAVYNDAGAIAVDSMGMSLAVTSIDNVDTSIVGSYFVSYSATDSAGQTSTAQRTVNVIASIPTTFPVITIVGNNPDSVYQNATYSDPGATAIDSMGMSVFVSAVSNVDTTIIGTYTITYSATDSLGQTSTATRTVDVVAAAINPVITILGNNPQTIEQYSNYSDAGATAVDSQGNPLTVDVVSNVDTSIIGTYAVNYSATDAAGNTQTATRTVEVVSLPVSAPVITIIGDNPAKVVINNVYNDAGATAVDSYGNPLMVNVVSNVDTTILGTYAVNYSATDGAGQMAQATRIVEVVQYQSSPTIASSSSDSGSHHHHHSHHHSHNNGNDDEDGWPSLWAYTNRYPFQIGGGLNQSGYQPGNANGENSENISQSGNTETNVVPEVQAAETEKSDDSSNANQSKSYAWYIAGTLAVILAAIIAFFKFRAVPLK